MVQTYLCFIFLYNKTLKQVIQLPLLHVNLLSVNHELLSNIEKQQNLTENLSAPGWKGMLQIFLLWNKPGNLSFNLLSHMFLKKSSQLCTTDPSKNFLSILHLNESFKGQLTGKNKLTRKQKLM